MEVRGGEGSERGGMVKTFEKSQAISKKNTEG